MDNKSTDTHLNDVFVSSMSEGTYKNVNVNTRNKTSGLQENSA